MAGLQQQGNYNVGKARELKKKRQICFINYTKAFDCVGHNKLWKIL